jgi:nitrogen fixation protein FixH
MTARRKWPLAIGGLLIGNVIAMVILAVVAHDGGAVDGARVRVTGYQRAHAGEAVDVELARLGGGHYRADVRERRGWHDLTVVADRGDAHYQQRIAVEAR